MSMADEGLSPASSDLEQLLQQELAALSSRSDSLCTSTEASQLCLDAAGDYLKLQHPQLQHHPPSTLHHSLQISDAP